MNEGPAPRVAGSFAWNIAGYLVPALVALFAIPPLIDALGAERFGLLTIAWVVMGYFSLFDFGLSRATTGAVATLTSTGRRDDMPLLIVSSAGAHLALGFAGGLLLGLLSGWLVGLFNLSGVGREEARIVFILLAVSIPSVVVTSSFRGALEGVKRFDRLNVVKIGSSVFTYGAPVIVTQWRPSLVAVVAVISIGRFATAVAHWTLVRSEFPELRLRCRPSWAIIRPMLGFGGWLTISYMILPLTAALDRFAIGSRLSAASVTPYASAYEVVSRLYAVPGSLMTVMFPIYTGLATLNEPNKLRQTSRTAASTLIVLMAGPVLVSSALADVLLKTWLGADLGAQSTWVGRVLLTGVLVNSVTSAPSTLLQATGFAGLVGRLQLASFLLYAPVVWQVAGRGIQWVAAAWLVRVSIESVVLFSAEHRVVRETTTEQRSGNGPNLSVTLATAVLALVIPAVLPGLGERIGASLTLGAFTTWAIWKWMLDSDQRRIILDATRKAPAEIRAIDA